MNNLINKKNVLTLFGVITLIEGVGFYLGAEAITKGAFSADLLTEEGLIVGTLMHQALASAMLVIAVIVLFARNLEGASGAKVLMGVGVGNLIFLAGALIHQFTAPVTPPLPAMILMAVFALLAFYTANKKED
jgi:hypothetical protein|tara:strand:+ start:704 stop:1102 length:399 start_codon:yes stop_codon:yes gene_type:complete